MEALATWLRRAREAAGGPAPANAVATDASARPSTDDCERLLAIAEAGDVTASAARRLYDERCLQVEKPRSKSVYVLSPDTCFQPHGGPMTSMVANAVRAAVALSPDVDSLCWCGGRINETIISPSTKAASAYPGARMPRDEWPVIVERYGVKPDLPLVQEHPSTSEECARRCRRGNAMFERFDLFLPCGTVDFHELYRTTGGCAYYPLRYPTDPNEGSPMRIHQLHGSALALTGGITSKMSFGSQIKARFGSFLASLVMPVSFSRRSSPQWDHLMRLMRGEVAPDPTQMSPAAWQAARTGLVLLKQQGVSGQKGLQLVGSLDQAIAASSRVAKGSGGYDTANFLLPMPARYHTGHKFNMRMFAFVVCTPQGFGQPRRQRAYIFREGFVTWSREPFPDNFYSQAMELARANDLEGLSSHGERYLYAQGYSAPDAYDDKPMAMSELLKWLERDVETPRLWQSIAARYSLAFAGTRNSTQSEGLCSTVGYPVCHQQSVSFQHFGCDAEVAADHFSAHLTECNKGPDVECMHGDRMCAIKNTFFEALYQFMGFTGPVDLSEERATALGFTKVFDSEDLPDHAALSAWLASEEAKYDFSQHYGTPKESAKGEL
jgi:hypothetical protein